MLKALIIASLVAGKVMFPMSASVTTSKSKPAPITQATINQVKVHTCTLGSSCYGWLTGVEVRGINFASDSRVVLASGNNVYTGTLVGVTGTTRILTDFTNLPHCTIFDTIVSGSTGHDKSNASVATICP
jgi:hypothetical protein